MKTPTLNNARDLKIARVVGVGGGVVGVGVVGVVGGVGVGVGGVVGVGVGVVGVMSIVTAVVRAITTWDSAARSDATPCRSARRLVGAAIRLLPAGCRGRWSEDLTAELAELAEAGMSRWGQVRHGLRVLAGVPTLRSALRELARETLR